MATGFYMEEKLIDLNSFITKTSTSLGGQTSCRNYFNLKAGQFVLFLALNGTAASIFY